MFSRRKNRQSYSLQQQQYRNATPRDSIYGENNQFSPHIQNPTINIVRQKLYKAAFQGHDQYSGYQRGLNSSGYQHGQHQSGDQHAHYDNGIGGGHQQHRHGAGTRAGAGGGGGGGGGVGSGGDQYHAHQGNGRADVKEPGVGYGGGGFFPQSQYQHSHQQQQLQMPYAPYQQTMMPSHYGRGVYGGGRGAGMMMYDGGGVMPQPIIYPQQHTKMYNPYMRYDPMATRMMSNPYQNYLGMMNPTNMYSGMMPQYNSSEATLVPEDPYPGSMPYAAMMMYPQYPYHNNINYFR